MRRASEPVTIARWIRMVCAAGLTAAVGCAQLAGIEEWKARDGCGEEGADPLTCKPTPDCIQCLYSSQPVCDAPRTDCTTDAASECNQIYLCSDGCESEGNPLSCVRTCCADRGGDTKFDAYISCVCADCSAQCGAETLGCDAICDP